MAQLMTYTQAQWAAMEAKKLERERRERESRTQVGVLREKLAEYSSATLVDIFQVTSDGKGRTYRIVDIREDENGVHLVVKGMKTILEGK